MLLYRGVAPSFIYKIDHRFPKTGDLKSNGKKYTLKTEITKLIVYSHCVSKLNIVTWRMSPDEDVVKRTETSTSQRHSPPHTHTHSLTH